MEPKTLWYMQIVVSRSSVQTIRFNGRGIRRRATSEFSLDAVEIGQRTTQTQPLRAVPRSTPLLYSHKCRHPPGKDRLTCTCTTFRHKPLFLLSLSSVTYHIQVFILYH